MPKLDDQISTLQQRLQLLKLRQQRVEARRQAMLAAHQRKADLRRRILLGGLILDKLRQGELDQGRVTAWLDQGLSRAADRALFDLPARAPADLNPADPTDIAPAQDTTAEPRLPPGLEDDHGHSVGQVDAAARGPHGNGH